MLESVCLTVAGDLLSIDDITTWKLESWKYRVIGKFLAGKFSFELEINFWCTSFMQTEVGVNLFVFPTAFGF